jgi:DNA-binding NarL/FixJ family response regulator
MKILLIEDNEHKKNLLLSFIKEEFSDIEVELKKSYNSGLRELIKNDDYSLILLDMSLPNYDIAPGESGGDFESLAGKYLLNEMYRRDININVVIVTMYKDYVDKEFDSNLKENFPNYRGVIYFDLNDPDGWKNELRTILNSIQL